MVELADQLTRQYLFIGDHVAAPQYRRRRHVVGIEPPPGAKDIVMRSRRLRGRQAYELGVATECVADRELEAATDAA